MTRIHGALGLTALAVALVLLGQRKAGSWRLGVAAVGVYLIALSLVLTA